MEEEECGGRLGKFYSTDPIRAVSEQLQSKSGVENPISCSLVVNGAFSEQSSLERMICFQLCHQLDGATIARRFLRRSDQTVTPEPRTATDILGPLENTDGSKGQSFPHNQRSIRWIRPESQIIKTSTLTCWKNWFTAIIYYRVTLHLLRATASPGKTRDSPVGISEASSEES